MWDVGYDELKEMETHKLVSGGWFGYRSLKLRRAAWAGETEGDLRAAAV